LGEVEKKGKSSGPPGWGGGGGKCRADILTR